MAQVIFVCSGCNLQRDGYFDTQGKAHKPTKWYRYSTRDVVALACSSTCKDDLSGNPVTGEADKWSR